MNAVVRSRALYLDDVSANILCQVWPRLRGRHLRRDYYGNFIVYLKRELTTFIRSPHPAKELDVQRTLESLKLLKQNMDKPLSQIVDVLKAEPNQLSELEASRLTEFLIRAWLSIELDIYSSSTWSITTSGGHEVVSLQRIIEGRFNNSVPREGAGSSGNLNRLTMKFLIDTFGWTVSWTSDLTEHLSVNSRTRVVTVYEHKICLLHHFEFDGHDVCPIPQGAIKEALDTLNLLFPPDDIPTQNYLENEGKSFHRLGACGRGVHYRDLSHYRYWNKGLAQLLRATEEEPLGFKQFVLDRRHQNFREVTTFWLAVVAIIFLTLGFGVISTVFAAKSYQVALMQYKLELAQVCSMPRANLSLPHYCA